MRTVHVRQEAMVVTHLSETRTLGASVAASVFPPQCFESEIRAESSEHHSDISRSGDHFPDSAVRRRKPLVEEYDSLDATP